MCHISLDVTAYADRYPSYFNIYSILEGHSHLDSWINVIKFVYVACGFNESRKMISSSCLTYAVSKLKHNVKLYLSLSFFSYHVCLRGCRSIFLKIVLIKGFWFSNQFFDILMAKIFVAIILFKYV